MSMVIKKAITKMIRRHLLVAHAHDVIASLKPTRVLLAYHASYKYSFWYVTCGSHTPFLDRTKPPPMGAQLVYTDPESHVRSHPLDHTFYFWPLFFFFLSNLLLHKWIHAKNHFSKLWNNNFKQCMLGEKKGCSGLNSTN